MLNASGLGSSDSDFQAVIDHLIQHPNEDMESVAKETGRDIYCELSLSERKQKLNNVVSTYAVCVMILFLGLTTSVCCQFFFQ